MTKCKILEIQERDNKQDLLILFDYYGNLRRLVFTKKAQDYFLNKYQKEIYSSDFIEVARTIKEKQNNKYIELYKVIKIY